MIRAAIIGDPARVPKYILRKFPEVQGAVQVSMGRIVLKLTRKIKGEKLSGQVLANRTGTLRRSISPEVQISGDTITTGIVSTNIEYAAIHEYGGKTPPHVILPKKGRALAFIMGGQQIIVKKVNHPGSKMPERSFMRTALAEMEPQVMAELENAISGVFVRSS